MGQDLEKVILTYPKLRDRLNSYPKELSKVIKCLDEIKADYSEGVIKQFGNLLDVSLMRLYDGINLNENGVNFKELMQKKNVVLVPNHQSHADYLAINYIVYRKYGIPLYVAGGQNLNIFPIGRLFRKSGCFFIRRSFQNDIVYRLTLEAYLHYLLKNQKVIEFFFEGGRSRTGRLLPPRYGLYQMLIEAHSFLEEEDYHDLVFVPVSIVHEYVPEQRSLTKELKGAKKVKESPGQLLGLFKFLSYQFGNVHITFGKPQEIELSWPRSGNGERVLKPSNEFRDSFKKTVQDLAFTNFREVGKNMVVTPTSILSLILLDAPDSAFRWNEILHRAKSLIDHCEKFQIPVTKSLGPKKYKATLSRAIDILIGNKKIDLVGPEDPQLQYYSIKNGCRDEILYFKNTILHHFLVPWMINMAWVSLFSGELKDVSDLKKLFIQMRNQLKHEFYLPTVKEMFFQAIEIVSHSVGRKITTLEDFLKLSHRELYNLATHVGLFSRSFRYISEAYYLTSYALVKLTSKGKPFSFDELTKVVKDIYQYELELGKCIHYQESFSYPLIRSSFNFFTHLKIIQRSTEGFELKKSSELKRIHQTYEKHLLNQWHVNVPQD